MHRSDLLDKAHELSAGIEVYIPATGPRPIRCTVVTSKWDLPGVQYTLSADGGNIYVRINEVGPITVPSGSATGEELRKWLQKETDTVD